MAKTKKIKTASVAGLPRPEATTGPLNQTHARIARKAIGAGGFGADSRSREAGMLIDTSQVSAPYNTGYKMEAYRSSYAFGLSDRTGAYDIPQYFVMMNEQNGGMIYWPVTLHEKYSWYRYFARSDAYIGRGLELLADLPMSKLTLNMPKMKDKKLSDSILRFFTNQLKVLKSFKLCQDILWELNMMGNVYVFHEWDDNKKMWSKAIMLPPEEVYIFQYPFQENKRVEYRPQRLIALIQSLQDSSASATPSLDDGNNSNLNQEIVAGIPQELKDMVIKEGCIVMDTDPSTGSFVHHVARRRSPYMDLGSSVLERVLVPMLQKEHYRYTQLSLASRNMTPKNLITADGLMPEEIDSLRTQVDLSYMDPEYSIITNYNVTWQQIGVQERFLDFSREYEQIENQVFAALGVTRELLTGEGQFSGTKITVEILNTMFLQTRQVLKEYFEDTLFTPICEAHGWFETDENGIKTYYCPEVGFNRLSIRDNAEVFDSLFQLYSKGSIPVDVLYELFNLNSEEMTNKLETQMFTAKDATFNRLLEEVNIEAGRTLVTNSDIVKKIAKYLGLKYSQPEPEGGVQPEEFGDGSQDGVEPEIPEGTESQEPEPTPEPEPEPESESQDLDPQLIAEEIVKSIPSDATDEDIQEAVDAVDEIL